jgi:hypothetical protein
MMLGLWILRMGVRRVLRVKRWGSHGKVGISWKGGDLMERCLWDTWMIKQKWSLW